MLDTKEKLKILDLHGCKPDDATCSHRVYDGKKMDPQAALTGAKGRTYCDAFFERDGAFRTVYDFDAKIHPAVKKIFDDEIVTGIQGSNAPMTEKERLKAELAKTEAENAAYELAEAERLEAEGYKKRIAEAKAKRGGGADAPRDPYGARP